MHVRGGRPLLYPKIGEAPAEFAQGLLRLLAVDEMHRMNEEAEAIHREVEKLVFGQLWQQDFGRH